eukprot:c27632_g1_i1 orf=531-2006(+)
MFTESSASGSGLASTLVVPTRFVWPHGGRRVYLCGSFTRWQEMLAMSPVEGCSSVFQVICSLPAGYHQFKFVVDGEWRYDDQQPMMKDPLGDCNNFVLVKEPGIVSVSPTNEVVGPGATMEVDPVSSSHRVPPEVQHQPLQGDAIHGVGMAAIDTSRQRVTDFLLCHTAFELLPESGKVIVLDVSMPVKQAFHALYEQGIPVAPLWDSDRQRFVGMLTASDFIAILRQIGSSGAMLSEEEFDSHTIAAWKDEKAVLAGHAQSSFSSTQRPLIYVGPDDSLREVAMKLLQHQVATVPVLHFCPQEPMSPQILHLASLSGILKCFWRHFRHAPNTLPFLSQPICTLRIGTWIPGLGQTNSRTLAMLHASASLSDALGLLMQARVSAIPIVDENGSLLDIYARSDITALARDKAYARLPLDQLTIAQALQIAQSAGGTPVGGSRCHMCLRTDSLQIVLERLALPGIRRLVCVEAGSKRVEGIVSLSDVFHFFLL